MPERIKEISKKLDDDDFKDETLRAIFKKIKGGARDFNDLLSKCEGEEKNELTRISLLPELPDPEKVLLDCIGWMNKNKREILLREIKSKINEADAKKDHVLRKKLQTKYLELKRTGMQE